MDASPITVILGALILCLGLVAVLAVGAGFAFIFRNQSRKRQELSKATGVQGEATVLDYQVTLTDSESDDIAWVRLEMRVPGMEPYVLEKTAPLRYAAHLKKDMIVSVWVDKNDPQNPDNVLIEIQGTAEKTS